MTLPDWATHLAIDEDGEVTAFDRQPVFLGPDAAGCGVWALPTRNEGRTKTVAKSPSANARVYPPSLARLLCVEVSRLPVKETETDG